jgi:hypothetical protein
MFNTIQLLLLKKNAFRLSLPHGILPHETFAVKSMDVNSNLLRLKLDMVYRDLPMEEAQKRFAELTATVLPVEPKPKVKVQRKAVKVLVTKSK